MLHIGFWEIMLIAVLALLVFGPEKIPEIARNIASCLNMLRRFSNNIQTEFKQSLQIDEKKSFRQYLDDLDDLVKNAPDQAATDQSKKKTAEKGHDRPTV